MSRFILSWLEELINCITDAEARVQAKATKEAQGPNPNAKVARNKFLPFQCLEMLTPITPWADALKVIDRDCPLSCGIDLPQRRVV